jgi:alkylhydroperoxidase family enzyme
MGVPQDVTSGRSAVAALAPGSAAAVDGLEATAWTVLDPDLVDLTARACAAVHGTVPLARPTRLGPSPWADRDAAEWRAFGDLTAAQRTALAFAEQFAVDVSAVTDDDRAALTEALGDQASTYAQVVYVADVVTRARTVLDRLFGASSPAEVAAAVDGPAAADPWAAIEEIIRVVPGLQELDAVTTELVRLRGARQHNCRICQSLRSFSAFEAGADDGTFAAVDTYATSDLSDANKAALAFTDAFIWTPGRIDDAVVADLRAHWSPAQQVELVLDIARNASNKFAVSMAADGTDVTEGYAVYDVKADGSIEYGLSRP